MFADELRRSIERAPRETLPAVASLLWRAFGEGQVTEAEAEALSTLIETRQAVPAVAEAPRKAVGSRPRSDASMERRRRWAASGRLPPALAARFTLAETAVLAVLASEVVKRGDCRLCLGHLAAIAGVSRSTVKNALRQARYLGLVTIEARAQTAWRNLSNVVRIVSPEWQVWNRLARRAIPQGGGDNSVTGTNTQVLRLWEKRGSPPARKLPRRQSRAQTAGSIVRTARRAERV